MGGNLDVRASLILFSATMRSILALPVFRLLNSSFWLGELVAGQGKEGSNQKNGRDGTSPSGPMVLLMALIESFRNSGSGKLGCSLDVILKMGQSE